MSTPKKTSEKSMSPALIALADRIENRAKLKATEIYERIAGSMDNTKARTGTTNAILRQIIVMMDDRKPAPGTNPVLIDFAREKIIEKIIDTILKEEEQNEH